jgi:CheY-like chemotaxis protein
VKTRRWQGLPRRDPLSKTEHQVEGGSDHPPVERKDGAGCLVMGAGTYPCKEIDMLDSVKPQRLIGRLLIVDDDERIRDLFQRVLVREGHDVQTAVDADDALRQAESVRFDAIIVDWRMPLVNGLGFLYRLRLRHDYRDVPVAIVTGDRVTNDELLADVRALGARLVFKPVWRNTLIELARTLLTSTGQEAAKRGPG